MSDHLEHKKRELLEWLNSVEDEQIINDLYMVKEGSSVYGLTISEPLVVLSDGEIASVIKGLKSIRPTITREEAQKSYEKYL